MQSIQPNAVVSQTRLGGHYELLPEWWGTVESVPTSESLAPKEAPPLDIFVLKETDVRAVLEDGKRRRQDAPPAVVRGTHLAISGGLAGASYEVMVGALRFRVKVTA